MAGENKLKRAVTNVPVVDDDGRVVGLVNRERLNQTLRLLTGAVAAGA
jgi:CBS-domain-containing membrane protein